MGFRSSPSIIRGPTADGYWANNEQARRSGFGSPLSVERGGTAVMTCDGTGERDQRNENEPTVLGIDD